MKKIKVLLVDDEPIISIGIRSLLDWDQMGIQLLTNARNGVEALAVIEKEKPDIVMTDIKMPRMNGLELAEESKKRFGDFPLFIFLTNYDEFGYVRNALKLQAVDYLIKFEINEESLVRTLENAIAILEDKHKILDADQTASDATNASIQKSILQRALLSLFANKASFENTLHNLNLALTYEAYQVAFLKLKSFNSLYDLDEEISNHALSLLSETFDDYPIQHMVFSLDTDSHILLFFTGKQEDLCQLDQALAISKRNLKIYLNIEAQIRQGQEVGNPFDLYMSYRSAQLGEKTIDVKNDFFCKNHLKRYLYYQSLIQLDKIGLIRQTQDILYQFENNSMPYEEASYICQNIAHIILLFLPQGKEFLTQCFEESKRSYKGVYDIEDVADAINWLQQVHEGFMKTLETKDQKKQEIEQIKDYILKNLDQNLNLTDVAELFHFNPNYFSQYFSKHVGQGFVDYLTQARIDLAKSLLIEKDLKISEVASRCGFDSAEYFSRVFKKNVGLSPSQYTNKMSHL